MSHAFPPEFSAKAPAPPVRKRRWKLQTRLVVTVLGIASLTLVMVAVASGLLLTNELNNQLNERVSDLSGKQAAQVEFALASGATDATAVLTSSRAEAGVLLIMKTADTGASGALVTNDYTITTLTSDVATTAITGVEEGLATAHGPGAMTDIAIAGQGIYRVAVVQLMAGSSVRGSVVLGLPLSGMQEPLTKLIWTVSAVTVAGLIVLALATLLVIRAGLRPLRQVVTTAEHVAALKLDQGDVAIVNRVADDAVDDHTEIGRVGAALNTMLDHVDESLQARARNEELMRRFVADASHELRTPLASIRGYSELSLRATDNPETTTTALERIQAQSVRMTRLVEDLLLLARLDEGQEIVLSRVDLTPLVIDAVSDARAAGRDHRWNVDVTGDSVMVDGDAGRLNQVVTNLLANARTHTPEGTDVTLRLTTEPGFAVISVNDNGPGIDPSVRTELFDRFARADRSRARKTGGTGLGLSIAKAIADAHGGSLTVASEPGATTFSFRLPLATATGTAVAPPTA